MAHFAKLDQNNVVLQVIVVRNEDILDDQGQESESIGVEFCQQLFGANTHWIQTSYNGNKRKNYAGVGYTYDQVRDAFISPQPQGDGWVLDEETCQWRNPELEAAIAATQLEVTRVGTGN